MSELETPYSLLSAYNAGMQGYIQDERAKQDYLATQRYQYFSEPNIRGSGLGKRVMLFDYARRLDPKCFTEKQVTGDCFVPGTLVRMGDGTEKPIEQVESGDVVASPFGGVRRVLSSFARPYVGIVCRLRAEGCEDAVIATEDHRFVSYASRHEWAWRQAGELAVGDRVFLPRGEAPDGPAHVYDLAQEHGCGVNPNEGVVGLKAKARRKVASPGRVRAIGGRAECLQRVTLNADVAWLIGMWLAEGSTDKTNAGQPHGLTWNLCKDEWQIARRIRRVLATEFGVEATTYAMPSKPSCVFVGVGCAPLARWMYRICGEGNTYSKRVPKEVLSSSREVRLWCLRGWLEGDGHVTSRPRHGKPRLSLAKVSGVSVCRGLVRDMKYLASSCGIRSSDRGRRAYGRSKASSELFFYGDSAVALFPGRLAPQRLANKEPNVWEVDNGFAPRVKSVDHLAYSGPVHCIEVADDHAFIANGYAVHNCVSHASRNARDITRAVSILVNREPYEWFKMGATEPTYGARGHGGQGMSPAVASRFERDVGFLARTDYGVVDLSKYDGMLGARWGSSGVPKEVRELCAKNKVHRISLVKTQEELMDAMFNGYAAQSGQSAAWEAQSNSKGIHGRARMPWAHAMAIFFYDDSKEFFPFRVWGIGNSWGHWNQKPKAWPKEYPEWVPGMILTSAEDFDVCVSSGDCWVYGGVDGYPPQRLPDLGSIGLLNA